MVHKVTALALSSLLITSLLGVAGAGLVEERPQATANGSATISVTASGQAAADADRAIVRVVALGDGASASEATDALNANASQLRDAFDGSNLSVEDVRTTGFHVSEERDGNGTYVARQSFEVRLSDTDDAGAAIDHAVDSGASEVQGVEFTLSDDRRQELRATAIDRAVDDADNQAEAVADSTGLTLGEIRTVSTGDSRVGPVYESADAAPGTAIDPGPVTVSATVEITYNASGE